MARTDALGNIIEEPAIGLGDASFYSLAPTTLPTKTELKNAKLAERTAQKLDNLGTYSRSEFNDADTTGFAHKGKAQIRLGTPGSSLGTSWVDTPESPWTAENRGIYNPATRTKEKRPLTPQEMADYQASKIALDNFIAGTTPASEEAWADMRSNPLTPENQALYDKAIKETSGVFDPVTAVGIKGQTDISGKRQIGDFVNPTYNPNETLSERLVATGNAAVRGNVGSTAGGESEAARYKRLTGLDLPTGQDPYADYEGATNPLVNVARAGAGGVLHVASSISSAPKKLYEFLGGDYLEDDSVYSKSVKGVIDTMAEGSKYIDDFNKGYVDTDSSNRDALEKSIEKNFEDGNYVTGLFSAIAENPAGALEFGASSYAFSKALTSTGITKIPGLLAATTDNADEAAAEFVKVNGREPDASEKGVIAALSAISTAVDSAAAGVVFKGAGANKITEGISAIVDKGIDLLPAQTVQQLITKPMVNALGRMAVEGIQEGPLQEGLKQLAANQNDVSKITDPEVLKAIYVQGVIGAISAPGMQATGAVVDTAKGAATVLSSKEGREAIDRKVTGIKEAISKPESTTPSSLGDPDSLKTNEPVTPGDAAVSTDEVLETVSEPIATTDDLPSVQAFDEQFNTIKENFSANAANVDEGVAAVGEEAVAAKVNAGAAQQIATLKGLMDAAIEEGATQKQQDLMTTKIQAMIPAYSAKTADELKTRLTALGEDTSGQVREVLGSSAADITDLNKVLANPDISKVEKKAVEAKIKAIKTYTSVAKEKLIGGGAKPGVFQYLSLIDENGKLPDNVIDEARAFIAGQNIKQRALEDAKAKFQANEAKSPNGRSKKVVVEYGAGNEVWYDYDKKGTGTTTLGSDGQIARIAKEREALEELQDVIDTIAGTKTEDTVVEAQEETAVVEPVVEAKETTAPEATVKPTEDVKPEPEQVVEEEVKEAPEAPTEAVLPTPKEVAIKISKGETITPTDEQVQVNEGPAIEKELQSIAKAAEVETTKETKQKETKDVEQRDSKKQEPTQEVSKPAEPEGTTTTEEVIRDETTREAIKRQVETNAEILKIQEEIDNIEARIQKAITKRDRAKERIKDTGGQSKLLRTIERIGLLEKNIDNINQGIEATAKILGDTSKAEATKARLEGYVAEAKVTKKIIKTNLTKRDKAREDLEYLFDFKEFVELKLREKSTEVASIGAQVIAKENAPVVAKGSKVKSLSDLFDAKVVASNLTVLKDKLVDGFSKAVDLLPLSAEDKTHLSTAKRLMDITEEYINRAYRETADHSSISQRDIDTVQGSEGFQSISRLLARDTNSKERELPPEVVTAIALATNDWLVNTASNRAHKRDDATINRFLGNPDGTFITDEMRARIADVDALSNDTANSIGAAVVANLGIVADTTKTEISEILLEKLKTEIGLIALQSMRHNKMLTIKKKKVVDIFGKDNIEAGTEAVEVNVIKFLKRGNALIDTKGGAFSIAVKAANNAMAVESRTKGPRTKKRNKQGLRRRFKEFVTKSFAGKFWSIPDQTKKALNKAENVEWTFNENYKAALEDMLATAEGRDTLKEFMGWVDEGTVHKRNLESVRGKNSAIELNITKLEEAYKGIEGPMYFDYFFSKNGRFFIDSNTVNPQTSKLHRFSMGTDPVTITTDEDVAMLDIALAQAFGVDTDKMTMKSALKEWQGIKAKLDEAGIAEMSMADAITAVNKLKIHGHDPEHIIAGIVEYGAVTSHLNSGKDIKGFESRLPLEIDAVTSGYILKTLQMPLIDDVVYHLEGGGVFIADDKGEFKYQSFGEQAEAEGTLDAYQKPAKVMLEKAKAMGEKLGQNSPLTVAAELATKADFSKLDTTSGKISGEMRKFMKNPFMVFNYGSGMTSIVNAMVDSSIDNLYDLIVSDKPADHAKVVQIIKSGATGMKKEKGKGWVKDKGNFTQMAQASVDEFLKASPDERLVFEVPLQLENNLRSNVKAGIGVSLEDTFTETYKVYIEAGKTVNDSFRAMFRLFKVKLDNAVDAEQKALGRHLTTAETDTIITKLKNSMPAIKTALAEGENDRLVIANEENGLYEQLDGAKINVTGQGKYRFSGTLGTEEQIAEAQAKANKIVVSKTATPEAKNKALAEVEKLKGPPTALSGQAKRRGLVEAYAAGAVIPIHYIDGALMTKTLSGTDSLGVHDALMTLVDVAVKDGKSYNQAMAELAASYSLPTEILSSLNQSINEATADEIAAVNAQYKAEFKGDPKEDAVPTVGRAAAAMLTLQKDSENARAKVLSGPIRYEHMAIEGGHFDWNTEGKPYVPQEPSVTLNKEFKDAPKETVSTDTVVTDDTTTPSVVDDGSVVSDTVEYTLNVTAAPDKVKAPFKLGQSNKYIGFGKSSTGSYREQLAAQGMPVNSGEYIASDVVFASVNGKKTFTQDNLQKTIDEVTKALDAGATVVTDSESYLASSTYNVGEQGLADALLDSGKYKRVTSKGNKDVGIWTKKRATIQAELDTVTKPEAKADLSKLTKAERTFVANYDKKVASFGIPTAKQVTRYNKLIEKAKAPKKAPALNRQAQKVQDAAQIPVSGSEDAKDQAVADAKRKELDVDAPYKNLDDEARAQLEEEHAAAQEYASVIDNNPNSGTITPTIEVEGISSASIAKAVAKTVNKIKACR